MNATTTYDVFHLVYWDWHIAADLFLGGLGVGAYLFAVFMSWWYRDEHPEVSRIGAVLAPMGVVLGLLFLLAELGHPLRIYQTLTGFYVTSPLWWGSMLQPLFIAVSGYYAYLWLRNDPAKVALRKKVGWVGVPLAVLVGAYHGFLMTVIKAKPLWNTEPSTVMAILSFAITGIAAVVFCLSFFEPRPVMHSIRLTRNVLAGAIVLELFTIIIWGISMHAGPEIAHVAWGELNHHYGLLFWGGAVGLGLVVPLALGGSIVFWNPEKALVFKVTRFVTSILILVGAYLFRYCIVMGGQLV